MQSGGNSREIRKRRLEMNQTPFRYLRRVVAGRDVVAGLVFLESSIFFIIGYITGAHFIAVLTKFPIFIFVSSFYKPRRVSLLYPEEK